MIINGTDLLEVKPIQKTLIIMETLTRIGIANFQQRIIYPSCYLYELNNKFFLAHFKQMFIITRPNRSYNTICDDDMHRRNAIAFLLKKWEMIDVDDGLIKDRNMTVDVIKSIDKINFQIKHKFNTNNIISYNYEDVVKQHLRHEI